MIGASNYIEAPKRLSIKMRAFDTIFPIPLGLEGPLLALMCQLTIFFNEGLFNTPQGFISDRVICVKLYFGPDSRFLGNTPIRIKFQL